MSSSTERLGQYLLNEVCAGRLPSEHYRTFLDLASCRDMLTVIRDNAVSAQGETPENMRETLRLMESSVLWVLGMLDT